jgi:hypothetical protein
VNAALPTTTLLTHSRCIQQDDENDWSTESAAMREVYSNAAFCIAATAAENGKTGLFFNRDVELVTPVKVELSRAMNSRNKAALNQLCGSYWLGFEEYSRGDSIDAAPLNQRAWAAQERFLSRRIIHFANGILFWECQESFASETHPDVHSEPLGDSRGSRALKVAFARYERRRVADGDSSVEKHTTLQESHTFYSNSVEKHIELQGIDTLYSKWPQFLENTRGGRALRTWFARYERRRVANGDSSVEKHTGLQDADTLYSNSVEKHIELQGIDTLYSKWRLFLAFYTDCKLTEGADVLVALDGVSREIATALQDEMIAGLWKRRLLSELCWRINGVKPCRPPLPTAPSWSWASATTCIIASYDDGSWSSMAKVEKLMCICRRLGRWNTLLSSFDAISYP